MASLNISIFDNFLSGGIVGKSFRNSPNATLNASTLTRSRVAWAILYFWVARRLLRRSSLVKVAIPVTVLFSRLENHRFLRRILTYFDFFFITANLFILLYINYKSCIITGTYWPFFRKWTVSVHVVWKRRIRHWVHTAR